MSLQNKRKQMNNNLQSPELFPVRPIQSHPSASFRLLQNHPDWVLVSEISPRHFVVLRSILVDLEKPFDVPGNRHHVFYEVSIYDAYSKSMDIQSQHRTYALGFDAYLEKVQVWAEFYRDGLLDLDIAN